MNKANSDSVGQEQSAQASANHLHEQQFTSITGGLQYFYKLPQAGTGIYLWADPAALHFWSGKSSTRIMFSACKLCNLNLSLKFCVSDPNLSLWLLILFDQ